MTYSLPVRSSVYRFDHSPLRATLRKVLLLSTYKTSGLQRALEYRAFLTHSWPKRKKGTCWKGEGDAQRLYNASADSLVNRLGIVGKVLFPEFCTKPMTLSGLITLIA